MFGMPAAQNSELVSMRAGKAILAGTTVTADPRKGMIILRKSEDGLMHLIWKDRTANEVVEDFIVFEGDASIRRVEECKDGYCMLVEFAQMDRKLFYYSQEPRKKGADWEDVSKEKDLLDKINSVLTGGPASGGGGGTGALGMTQAELLAMLGGTVVPQAATSAAAAAAPAPAAPADAAAAAATPAAAAAAPGSAFSADAISNILSGIPAAPAAPTPATPAGGAAFSADAISNILSGLGPAGPPAQPVTVNDVLRPEEAVPRVDAAMEATLAEHLPQGGPVPETARETLSTPQMAQAAMRFTEALYQGEAAGLIREMNLNPTGLGVEPFLRALQASTDEAAASAGTDAMETDDKTADKMDES